MQSFIRYLKAAAVTQLNIVIFAGLLLFALLLGSPLLLVAALAGEALWLGFAPRLGAFRAYADKREKAFTSLDRAKAADARQQALPTQEQARFARLERMIDTVHGISDRPTGLRKELFDAAEGKIDDVRDRYLALLAARASYRSLLEQQSDSGIAEKLEKLKRQAPSADPRLDDVQRRQISILEERLTKRAQATADARVIDAQLDAFDDLVALFQEQAVTLTTTSDVTSQLDGMLGQIEVTEQTLHELESSFESFDRELKSSALPGA